MCLSKVFLDNGSNRSLLVEDVASLKEEGNHLVLRTLFGEQKEINARIREIDFLNHTIVLTDVKG